MIPIDLGAAVGPRAPVPSQDAGRRAAEPPHAGGDPFAQLVGDLSEQGDARPVERHKGGAPHQQVPQLPDLAPDSSLDVTAETAVAPETKRDGADPSSGGPEPGQKRKVDPADDTEMPIAPTGVVIATVVVATPEIPVEEAVADLPGPAHDVPVTDVAALTAGVPVTEPGAATDAAPVADLTTPARDVPAADFAAIADGARVTDLASPADGARVADLAPLRAAPVEAPAPGPAGRAVSNAAAARHPREQARQVALAALKHALTTQGADSSAAVGGLHDTRAAGFTDDDATAALPRPIGPDLKTAAVTPVKAAPATLVASHVLRSVDPGAGHHAAGDQQHDGARGGHGQIQWGEVIQMPPRAPGHPSQAVAAFYAAVAAGAGQTSQVQAPILEADALVRGAVLDSELPASIVQSIRLQTASGGGEARINLNPGFLGQMTVGVRVDGTSVSASLHASNADVRDWIRTNEAMLRQALADQGFNLERLVILDEEPAESTGDQSRRQQDDGSEQRRRRQPRAAGQGSFEALI